MEWAVRSPDFTSLTGSLARSAVRRRAAASGSDLGSEPGRRSVACQLGPSTSRTSAAKMKPFWERAGSSLAASLASACILASLSGATPPRSWSTVKSALRPSWIWPYRSPTKAPVSSCIICPRALLS